MAVNPIIKRVLSATSVILFSSISISFYSVGAGFAKSYKKSRPPSNSPTAPGGGLDPNKSCGSKEKLISLIPKTSPVMTSSANPKLYFYIPYESKNIRMSDFSVHEWDGSQEKEIYRGQASLPSRPGITRIDLSNRIGISLQEDKIYHWYLELYCQDNRSARPDLTVSGYLQRTSSASNSSDNWHDSLSEAITRKDTSFSEMAKWKKMLTDIKQQDLISKEFVDPIELR